MTEIEPPYLQLEDGQQIPIRVRGYQLLNRPMLNRGTAFTEEERHVLGLMGLLPAGCLTLEEQVKRVYRQLQQQPNDLAKNLFLTHMRDRNEVLFYRLVAEHIEEILPIVYTPTIGQAIEQYSHWYSRPRGVYLSINNPELIEESLLNYGLGSDEVDLIVVTDSEGILGIGDQGVGGVAITTGKLSVYTAAAGIHPRRCIPVVLDVGTDNLRLLHSDSYVGARQARVRGRRYDEFVDTFVKTVQRLYPNALLHFEDFAADNAHRLLERYRHEMCAFNDDIQGTAAIVLAAILSAVYRTGGRLRDQRIVVYGAGSAGIGIANAIRDAMRQDGLSETEASARFWCLGSRGLITEGGPMRDFQEPYARPLDEVYGWADEDGVIGLKEVVREAHPTILIGSSAQPGSFTEEIVRQMQIHAPQPIIFALSNPTSLAEAHPQDLLEWTDGQALIATGSPFEPVQRGRVKYRIAQANNALMFPGLGLGVAVSKATRVSDGMVIAAARAIAALSQEARRPGASLLPAVNQLREVSAAVALAVVATAQAEGLARVEITDPLQTVLDAMWKPEYAKIVI
ncbi:NAD-dependent malic enzyme [Tessaracoccus sp. OH4464_COT-324]|uniref:NAD-dependent malic enzyme n=1 Tax=Tessaracoccus sp. OH4464_COT-324 TaxID=2491059 RepID=UPI000F6369BD|nr:NAD-dependent malic enzyme [Tessaracoccus sp. OH4464_COT-324]RRD47684.1 NAD-dependent malic enzyme [Tessaracoccus sp. OH4464_COT-324]